MMIYDLLKDYRRYLLTIYRPSTAETYYKKLCTIFKGQSITNTVDNLNIDKILDQFAIIKYSNRFSQNKNAFLHFCEYQKITLSADTLDAIKGLERGTRKKHRKLKPIEFSQIDKRIKHIRNKKLKLSYQLIIATGLRISELASLTLNDCTITKNEVTFSFIGKGGANEVVCVQHDSYNKLYYNVKEHIESSSHNKNRTLFYSANYLQRKAKELGFGCHDLRRAFAKLEYKKCKSKQLVMQKLRHANIRTTNRYLRSKVKI